MKFKKVPSFFIKLAFFCLIFINSSLVNASCNCSPANTHTIVGVQPLSGLPSIPSTGGNYCLKINSNSILEIDDSWNADNICIELSASGKIVIKSGELANLTNSTVKGCGPLINPFRVEAGAIFQVAYCDIERLNVGFNVSGELLLYDVNISGVPGIGLGVAVVCSGAEKITVEESSFFNLQWGMTLQGVDDLSVSDNSFNNIIEHGIAATGVNNTLYITDNQFDNLKEAMHLGSGSTASHFIYDNTTNNVETGAYINTLLGNLYMNGNTFDFIDRGIEIENVENIDITGNAFASTFTGSSINEKVGMDVTNCHGTIADNIFKSMNVGAFFRDYNGLDNSFSSNEFAGDFIHGLYLDNGARIGPQCHQYNTWTGVFHGDYGAFSPDLNVKGSSKFTVNEGVGSEFLPVHSPADWFIYNPYPCPDAYVPGPLQTNPNASSNSAFGQTVEVYPNPTSHYIDVALASFSGKAIVELRDLTGRIIRENIVEEGASTIQFDLSDTSTGLYILTVKSEAFEYTEKVIVSK